MANSYTRFSSFVIGTALIVAMVFTCVYAQGPAGSPSRQSGAASASGYTPAGSSGGMPGQGIPGGTTGGGPSMVKTEYKYIPAIFINDGVYVPEGSVTTAVVGGKIENTSASDIKITSNTDNFNGIYVTGTKSDYTLSDSTIEFYGNRIEKGTNFGVGAGALVTKGGTLTLKNVKITTNGLLSSTAVSMDGGTMKIYDCILTANGGKVPYENTLIGSGPGYVGPPEPLGITGNARGTNVTSNSKMYLYNSKITANGWGALSTDDPTGTVYLEANNCDIQVVKSGYGTYADNDIKVVINDSRCKSATYTGMISGSGKIYLNNTSESTAVNCVMIHAPGTDFTRIGTLEIKGGKIQTKEASVLVKSANADIVFDGAELLPKNGILLKSVINDSKRSAVMRWLLESDKKTTPVTVPVTGIRTTFKNMELKGNIVHDDSVRPMSLTFVGTTMKGAITGSIYTITDVSVSLDSSSKWTATADSRVTLVGNTVAKSFDAPKGVTITAIAGKDCTLKGKYNLASGGLLNVKVKD
jgi:hypothetical protein